MADEQLEQRVKTLPDPGNRRVESRAAAEPDDTDLPEEQARTLLAESDARVADPAARTLDDDRVDRRTSDEATPPVDAD
jgi:hypothetical protein